MLQRQWHIACKIWALLACQHALDLQDQNVTLADLHRVGQSAGAGCRTSSARTTTQRTAEVRALVRDNGWATDLGAETTDDLVAYFSRAARSGPVLPELPLAQGLLLGGLARPVSDIVIDIGGLDSPLLAPLFLFPAAARRAMDEWRCRVLGRLEDQQSELSRLTLAGDADADAQLIRHLARWGGLPAHVGAVSAPECTTVQLTLLERTRLRWVPGPSGPTPRLSWVFRVDDVVQPWFSGLIAGDPGMRQLWTLRSTQGLTRYANPMSSQWKPPPPATPPGFLRRPWALELAHLQRQAVLVQGHLQPVQEAAFGHLMAHPQLAIEALDLAGFARLRADYLGWLGWSGALIQHRYIVDVAALSRRLAVIPARAGASRTCSVCWTARSMRFRGRVGRCRVCGAHNLDRDDNAARNIYRLGQAALR